MENAERVRFAIREWHEKEFPQIRERFVEAGLFTEIDHIVDIVGVRRSGKTFIMFLMAKKLAKEFGKEAVIYINFENKVLYPINEGLLDEILNYVFENGFSKAFLFLDEIQNVKSWERWARSTYDAYKGKIKIIVSGSSSKIIRGDIGKILTGRHVSIKVFPLSFREFLDFKGKNISAKDLEYSIKEQAKIKVLLEEYFSYSSFPEIILAQSLPIKSELLKAYYEDILYKDVIEKYNIKEKQVLENFVKFLYSNISGYFSYKRGKDYLSSFGISTSTRTLLRYTSILEEVFLFFFVPILSFKARDQLKYPRKVYAIDVALRNVADPTEDMGRKTENVVYLELRRRQKNSEINYWKSEKQEEVDFAIREGQKIKSLIQVCWDITKKETKERETKALIKASAELGCSSLLIITNNYNAQEKIAGKKIIFKPLWKWLLEE
ncbi:MAG: ATP-binding protein [archaeon]|nr:ATP-binding protein [archaeon]